MSWSGFVCLYLNHICRAEPQFRRDSPAIQNTSYPQTSRVFSSCKYIQESGKRRKKIKKLIFMWLGLIICVRQCLCMYVKISYDVLPLPVAPMMAFIPGLMMPLQQQIHQVFFLSSTENTLKIKRWWTDLCPVTITYCNFHDNCESPYTSDWNSLTALLKNVLGLDTF